MLNSPHGFSKKTIDVGGRSFSLQILKFDNGYFVSVTEGTEKLGSMVVSMAIGPKPITTTIIPAKHESLFLQLTAERISTHMKGIVLVSCFIQQELSSDTAKAIMTEIMEMIN